MAGSLGENTNTILIGKCHLPQPIFCQTLREARPLEGIHHLPHLHDRRVSLANFHGLCLDASSYLFLMIELSVAGAAGVLRSAWFFRDLPT